MNLRKFFGFLLCFAVVLPFAFFVLCTILAIGDPENRIALVLFIPVDGALVGLFLLGVHLIRGGKKPPVEDYRPVPTPGASGKTIRCPDCGATFPADQKRCTFCDTRLP